MVEYKLEAGRVSVVKVKDVNIREVKMDNVHNMWHKISPDSYVVEIQLKKAVFDVVKRNGVNSPREQKGATFYDIETKDEIEALREVQRSLKLSTGVIYHPIFLRMINEVLDK